MQHYTLNLLTADVLLREPGGDREVALFAKTNFGTYPALLLDLDEAAQTLEIWEAPVAALEQHLKALYDSTGLHIMRADARRKALLTGRTEEEILAEEEFEALTDEDLATTEDFPELPEDADYGPPPDLDWDDEDGEDVDGLEDEE